MADYLPAEYGAQIRLSAKAATEMELHRAVHVAHKRRDTNCYWCIAEAFGVTVRGDGAWTARDMALGE